jgi:phage-related minor tail protein
VFPQWLFIGYLMVILATVFICAVVLVDLRRQRHRGRLLRKLLAAQRQLKRGRETHGRELLIDVAREGLAFPIVEPLALISLRKALADQDRGGMERLLDIYRAYITAAQGGWMDWQRRRELRSEFSRALDVLSV